MVNTGKEFIENYRGHPFLCVIKTLMYAFKSVSNAA